MLPHLPLDRPQGMGSQEPIKQKQYLEETRLKMNNFLKLTYLDVVIRPPNDNREALT